MSGVLVARRRLQEEAAGLVGVPAWREALLHGAACGALCGYNAATDDPALCFASADIDAFAPQWLRCLEARLKQAAEVPRKHAASWAGALDAELAMAEGGCDVGGGASGGGGSDGGTMIV